MWIELIGCGKEVRTWQGTKTLTKDTDEEVQSLAESCCSWTFPGRQLATCRSSSKSLTFQTRWVRASCIPPRAWTHVPAFVYIAFISATTSIHMIDLINIPLSGVFAADYMSKLVAL